MTISFPVSRPKAAQTVTITPTFVFSNPVSDDPSDTVYYYGRYQNLQKDAIVVTGVTTTNTDATITTTGNKFANIGVGFAVTGTGIPAGTTVLSKTDNNSLELSANANASGTVNLTFTPVTFNATVYGLEVSHTASGNTINVRIAAKAFDGTQALDLTDAGVDGVDFDATSGVSQGELTFSLNLDQFLTNAGVSRTNS